MLNLKLLSLLFYILSSAITLKPNMNSETIKIKIENIKKDKGKIVIELYSSESKWLEEPDYKTTISPTQESLIISFDAPRKIYAVSIYQDLNQNGKLDQGLFGIPTEPIGFGNNYKPMGKPRFQSATIDFNMVTVPPLIKLY